MAYKVLKFFILLILGTNSVWSLDICEDQLNGAQLLHPLDCSKYIVCRFGTTYRIETCDGGRHFSRLTAECVDPLEAACNIDLIKQKLVVSNECVACRSICGCFSEPDCSTSSTEATSSSTPESSPSTSTVITPGESTTNAPNQTTPGGTTPESETTSSQTPCPDLPSASTTSSSTTDQSSTSSGTTSNTTGSFETTPNVSSETTEALSSSSPITETTSNVSSDTTPNPDTSSVAPETTPNTSGSNTSGTPGLDTSSIVTETTLPDENTSSTHTQSSSSSTTDATTIRPSSPSSDTSSSISADTTTTSSSPNSSSETTSITPSPETPTSATPSTTACTNNLKICIGKPNFSTIYVPGSCREYAICIDNCANVLSCPNNLLYDLENHICTYPQNVNCSNEMVPPSGPSAGPSGTNCESHGKCANQPDGTLFADDSNDGYIVCQCECEVARPCPGGLVFNEESKVCDFPVIN